MLLGPIDTPAGPRLTWWLTGFREGSTIQLYPRSNCHRSTARHRWHLGDATRVTHIFAWDPTKEYYSMKFEELRLIEPLLRAVHAARYDEPTPIQAEAIPLILDGRDVLGCAQTGTGKTAAFALPILQQLRNRPLQTKLPQEKMPRENNSHDKNSRDKNSRDKSRRKGPANPIRCLVLCPTRELAQQIHDSFRSYGQFTGLRQTVVYGGVNQNPQARALRRGVDILIATPGRLLDLMNQRLVNLSNIEILVLDESDHMLDMGFIPDIRRILTHVPTKRQTLFFSATMPPPIRKLADEILKNPVSVSVTRVSSPATTVDHWVHHVEQSDKPKLLLKLLEETHTRTLVFSRTKHGADKIVKQLDRSGVPAVSLHGNKSQGARTRALADFRSAKTPVLIATDIAARGLDVEDITLVVNYDLPPEPETYVHRIGRTGRAGATGIARSFCTPQEYKYLKAIERFIRKPLQAVNQPVKNLDSRPAGGKRPSGSNSYKPRKNRFGPGRTSNKGSQGRGSRRSSNKRSAARVA